MKQVDRFNYRVVVTPMLKEWDRDVNNVTEEQRARQVAKYIERHVDNVAVIEVVHDTVSRCSHCKNRWDDDTLIPDCCARAQAEFMGEIS
jgi:hypothetical protein